MVDVWDLNWIKNMMIYINYIIFGSLLFLSSCTQLPEVAKSIEDIADDDILYLELSKGAIQKDTNVHVNIDVSKAP